MYISYDYYRVFYYVAKCGSVSQAAKQLINNQPNLTRAIRNLESELGCALFLRSNRGMRLTPEGERLYNHVRIAFTHIEAGEAEIAESRNLEAGSVYVAASEVALRCLLLPVLKKYRMLYPGVHLRREMPIYILSAVSGALISVTSLQLARAFCRLAREGNSVWAVYGSRRLMRVKSGDRLNNSNYLQTIVLTESDKVCVYTLKAPQKQSLSSALNLTGEKIPFGKETASTLMAADEYP